MDQPRSCGCKGRRTCLLCESLLGLKADEFSMKRENSFVYCPYCNKAWKGWDVNLYEKHPHHDGEPLDFPGVFILLDFLSQDEESTLMKCIDEMPWDMSQSGRRKQNFGPKTNFKKRKIVPGNFKGFPEGTKFIQDRFERVNLLRSYETIEQCSLEYDASRGASIDPHIDDCWIWGERIVTVNCLTDSVLTMTPYVGSKNKYNLLDAEVYGPVVNGDGSINTEYANENVYKATLPADMLDVVVRIPMPKRSLLVLYGESRYHWEHSVLREDISERRVCVAYREFTPPYLNGGPNETIGRIVRDKSKQFWDHRKIDDALEINN